MSLKKKLLDIQAKMVNIKFEIIIGFSLLMIFSVPTEAPQNLTVLNVTGSRSAILSWEPVSPESIKGNFKGYKVNTFIIPL